MKSFLENLLAGAWNRMTAPAPQRASDAALDLGVLVVDERTTRTRVSIPQAKRPEHIGIFGRTGTGKSALIRHMAGQDIRAGCGFLSIDLHNDTTPWLLRTVAQEEIRQRRDLSTRLIIVEPGDPEWSVGLNVLERRAGEHAFVQLAEFSEILKQRWQLDHLGARTEELLRNSLHVLADNGLTLVELTPLLTNVPFRALCLQRVTNPEVETYFRARFDPATEAMQAVYRDAILNKVSAFIADPRFRHILGQRRSTISLLDALDNGYWVLLNLDKGRLGEQATTLGSLLLTKLKNALFARRSRRLFTIYADELQNLIAIDSGIETLTAEARKYSVSLVAGTQFLEQYPPQMRAAILAIGTHILFQLSSGDADKMAVALDGGKRLAELLRNLPPRNLVAKTGHERWRQAVVPTVHDPRVDVTDLYNRCRARWARRRVDIEADLQARYQRATRSTDEVLDEWE